jgi:hypothetical protein
MPELFLAYNPWDMTNTAVIKAGDTFILKSINTGGFCRIANISGLLGGQVSASVRRPPEPSAGTQASLPQGSSNRTGQQRPPRHTLHQGGSLSPPSTTTTRLTVKPSSQLSPKLHAATNPNAQAPALRQPPLDASTSATLQWLSAPGKGRSSRAPPATYNIDRRPPAAAAKINFGAAASTARGTPPHLAPLPIKIASQSLRPSPQRASRIVSQGGILSPAQAPAANLGLLCDQPTGQAATALGFSGLVLTFSGDPLLPIGASAVLAVYPGGDPTTCPLNEFTVCEQRVHCGSVAAGCSLTAVVTGGADCID